jgi:RecB family endonuclease NucS
MRLVIATCSVDYAGRLTAHLPMATRLLMVKADGSISIHCDDRAFKPLNWMNPPCRIAEEDGRWVVSGPKGDTLTITIETIHSDIAHDLGEEPGLQKDGVEAHLQELLAANPETLAPGLRLVKREFFTDIGPVDLLCKDADGACVAVEIKRVGEIAGVEQLRAASRASRSTTTPCAASRSQSSVSSDRSCVDGGRSAAGIYARNVQRPSVIAVAPALDVVVYIASPSPVRHIEIVSSSPG